MRIGMMSKHERRNIEKILTKLIAEQTLKRAEGFARRAMNDLECENIERHDGVKINIGYTISNARDFFDEARYGVMPDMKGFKCPDMVSGE